MPHNLKTHIFCYDDHRGFSEDVRKRFSDTDRYHVTSFQTREEFLRRLEADKDHKFCKVAILGVHDTTEHIALIEQLTVQIKKVDQKTGLILLGQTDKIEEIKKTVKFNIDAYIPRNANTILRVHNAVKKLISEHSIGIFKRRRNFSLYILVSFLALSALFILIAYFKLPLYF